MQSLEELVTQLDLNRIIAESPAVTTATPAQEARRPLKFLDLLKSRSESGYCPPRVLASGLPKLAQASEFVVGEVLDPEPELFIGEGNQALDGAAVDRAPAGSVSNQERSGSRIVEGRWHLLGWVGVFGAIGPTARSIPCLVDAPPPGLPHRLTPRPPGRPSLRSARTGHPMIHPQPAVVQGRKHRLGQGPSRTWAPDTNYGTLSERGATKNRPGERNPGRRMAIP